MSRVRLTFFLFSILLVGVVHAAVNQSTRDYFCVLKKIQRLPAKTRAINAASSRQLQLILTQLKNQGIILAYKKNSEGDFVDAYNEAVNLYIGGFDNTGQKEFLFVVTRRSMNVNTIMEVYTKKNNRFVRVEFDKIVISNLFPGSDMGPNFPMWIAKPFAYIKNRATYLRFMDYPGTHADYDSKKLTVYTYLWQGRLFKKVAQSNGAQFVPCY